MKRLVSIIAATAAAAAVAAAITIPAGADNANRASQSDELATFVSCLRAHGLDVPADLQGRALKMWIGEREGSASVDTALEACGQHTAKDHGAPPEELVACLRDHGLNPPSELDRLKPWIEQQSSTDAGKAAFTACGFETREVNKAADCAGDKAADGAKAAKAHKPKATPDL